MSLYSKLLLILLPLLLIPLLVIRVAVVAESDLRHAAEQRLLARAQVYAELLNGQKAAMSRWPELGALALQDIVPILPQRIPIAVDGRVGDWSKLANQTRLYSKAEQLQGQAETPATVSFRFAATQDADSLYLLFMVRDDRVTYRRAKQLALNRNDYISLMLRDQEGQLRRYVVSAKKQGLTPVHRVKNDNDELAVESDKRLRSYWRSSKFGYNVEVRIPLSLAARGLGFAVSDVDEEGGVALSRVGTLQQRWQPQLQRFSQPSPQLEMFFRSFDLADQHAFVADAKGRVIAVGGSLQNAATSHPGNVTGAAANLERSPLPDWRRRLYLGFFSRWLPLDQRFGASTSDSPTQTMLTASAEHQRAQYLLSALKGQAASQWQSIGNALWKLSAAAPIAAGAATTPMPAPIGAVVVEEVFSAALLLSNGRIVRLLELAILLALFSVIATVLILLTVVWRMRRLRSAARRAVAGKYPSQWPGLHAADELGELSRSTALLASASAEASQYILALGTRLSIGLRPASALISSSADLLEQKASATDADSTLAQPYLARLRAGLLQFDAVLDRVTAPQRLNRLIAEAQREDFDLAAVLDVCVASYRKIYPQQGFSVQSRSGGMEYHGVPELFALIVHELVANAVQNARQGTDVEIELNTSRKHITLEVNNRGAAIDVSNQRIFSAFMTASVNPLKSAQGADQTPEVGVDEQPNEAADSGVAPQTGVFAHGWGVGLYLAELAGRELGGQLRLKNHSDRRGVVAVLTLPKR